MKLNSISITTIFSFFLILLTSACKESGAADTTSETGSTLSDEERTLDKAAFEKAIRGSGTIIDLRFPEQYAESHIDKAVNINFFDKDFKHKLLELDRSKTYYLYDKNESIAYRAMKFMESNDFTNIFILKGGYMAWTGEEAPAGEAK